MRVGLISSLLPRLTRPDIFNAVKRYARINPATLALSRARRHDQSKVEHELWWLLRNRGLGAFKFRREVPIGPYSADFCCLEKKLIVEVDGRHHDQTGEHDLRREEFLRSQGFRVIRFSGVEVLRNRAEVGRRILEALNAD